MAGELYHMKINRLFVSELRYKAAARKLFEKTLNVKYKQRAKVITTDEYRCNRIASSYSPRTSAVAINIQTEPISLMISVAVLF